MSGGISSVAVAVVSTALTIYSQQKQQQLQQKAMRNQAEYNAQIAENEAATQKQLAQNEISKGVADRERQQRAAARAMGEMRAGMGASGFQMDTGSMASLLEESATEHQYDSNTIRQNSEQAAWQHMVGVTAANNNQAFSIYQRNNAGAGSTASLLGSIGEGMGRLNSAYNNYQNLQNASPPAAGMYANASGTFSGASGISSNFGNKKLTGSDIFNAQNNKFAF